MVIKTLRFKLKLEELKSCLCNRAQSTMLKAHELLGPCNIYCHSIYIASRIMIKQCVYLGQQLTRRQSSNNRSVILRLISILKKQKKHSKSFKFGQ